MADTEVALKPHRSTILEETSNVEDKPLVIGIYGIDGSGKSTLLTQLKQTLEQESFAFYEGSEVIAEGHYGGLKEFQMLDEEDKGFARAVAMQNIKNRCAENGQVAVVTGHFMLWSAEKDAGQEVWTQKDQRTYTHILYLNVPVQEIMQRRKFDTKRHRPNFANDRLRQWQEIEKTELRKHCRENRIQFMLLSQESSSVNNVARLLRNFREYTRSYNTTLAEGMLDEILSANKPQLKTMLVFDADKTLAAEDAGEIIWKLAFESGKAAFEGNPLSMLFKSPLMYSYAAFRQAMLLYEETFGDDDDGFGGYCRKVADKITLYPEVKSMLQQVKEERHVGAVVITGGLRRVWDMVLEKEDLSDTVKVIGGGRVADEIVVNDEVKGALVTRLQEKHGMYVWAFGDSPLDLLMLQKADLAFVVVGEEQARSKTMEKKLEDAIENKGLRARQILLPQTTKAWLDPTKIPVATFEELESTLSHPANLHFLHATDELPTQLLSTHTRNAAVSGPALREAHRRVGWYLAVQRLTVMIGLEDYDMSHVLPEKKIQGQRLAHERQTTIVALMRAGEPMAFGVSDAFPLAMYVHAKEPSDLKSHHLDGQSTIVLVDFVINTGGTVLEFVERIRELHDTIRIVVVAGVVQEEVIGGGRITQSLASHRDLSIVALRLSTTKFKGSGTTDTGNRLFNTTHVK